MYYDNIQIGDRLEIVSLQDKKLNKVYVSRVENIIGKNELMVHVPISYGQLVKLSVRELYASVIFTKSGMIRFDTEILKYVKEQGFNFINIRLISDGEKIQRREFFRYNCLLPIKFIDINESEEENINKNLYDGIIKDIGGGGVRFVSKQSINEMSKVKCVVMLGDDYIVLMGNILQKEYFPDSTFRYEYRIQFIGIDDNDKERIIRYVFNEQRKELIKKRGQ